MRVSSADVLLDLDDRVPIACQGRDLDLGLRPQPSVTGSLGCNLPGFTTGLFQVTVTYEEALQPEPWQITLAPNGSNGSDGLLVGGVHASVGPDRAHISVTDLVAEHEIPQLDSLPASLNLSAVGIVLVKTEGWAIHRVEAGPGTVRLVFPQDEAVASPEGPPQATNEEHGRPDQGDESPENLPLNELEESASSEAADSFQWELVEQRLRTVEELMTTSMTLSTTLANRVDINDIDLEFQLGSGHLVPVRLLNLTSLPGQTTASIEFANHQIGAAVETISGAESDGLALAVSVDSLDLAAVSETLGTPGLLTGAANLRFHVTTGAEFEVVFDLGMPDLVVNHAAISTEPIALLPQVTETRLRFAADEEVPFTFHTEGTLGEHVAGRLDLRVARDEDGPRLSGEFHIDNARCRDLLAAIPEGLFLHMDRDAIRFAGRAGLDGTIEYSFGNHRSFRMLFGEEFPGTCRITRMPRGFRPEALLEPDYRHVVSEDYSTERVVVGPATAGWTPIEDLPEYIPAIMYLTEQRDFLEDPAISVSLINKAVRINLIYGRWAYGGSTVTQQLVKNLFLDRNKTLARKLEEALISWALEAVLTKEQILELYLNCIEFGPDIWGIEAGAQYYFNVSAPQLSPIQVSYLAGLKPSPRSGGNHRRRGQTPRRQRWQDRLLHHIQLLADRGFIPQSYVDAQETFIIPLGENALPRIAPIDD